MWKILFNQKRLKYTRKELRNNMTEAENKLWGFLKWKKINWLKFRRQHSVWRYILDFYCPEIKLCIELDWSIHDKTKEYDQIRTDYLNNSNIEVLRFSNEDIFDNINFVIEEIKKSSPPAREGLGEGLNILLTWNSKWIWKYLSNSLEKDNNILWISRATGIDLTNLDDIKKIKFDGIFDVIILNAWVWEFWNFEDNSLKSYENIISLNLLSNIRLLKILEKNISGKTKIIFIWSIISKKSLPWASVYQASKFWLRGLALWFKCEWKKVFLVNPKIVDTDFHLWKIDLNWNFPKTELEDILKIIESIIKWDESRFEIDL
jgi:very-short-patch-repair endonuclease